MENDRDACCAGRPLIVSYSFFDGWLETLGEEEREHALDAIEAVSDAAGRLVDAGCEPTDALLYIGAVAVLAHRE